MRIMQLGGWVTLIACVASGMYYSARLAVRRYKGLAPHIALLRKWHPLVGVIALFAAFAHSAFYSHPTLNPRAWTGYAAFTVLVIMALNGVLIKRFPKTLSHRSVHRLFMLLLIIAVVVHLLIKKILLVV